MSKVTSLLNFEEYAEGLMEEFKLPGVSIGIAKAGELIYTYNRGYLDLQNQRTISSDTVFGIGSITKSMTCLAIMQLQEAGKLSVHDPIVTYLPEFRTPDPERTKKMTIHHLMTHSTGLPPLPSLYNATQRSIVADPEIMQQDEYKDAATMQPIDTYEELMEFIAKLDFELLGEPGTEFSYSNDSYALLGTIIERVSGQSYEDYMRTCLLEPAGMTSSVFLPEELEHLKEVAPLYTPVAVDGEKKAVYSPLWWDSPAMRAAGFLKSTVNDMLRYLEIYRTGGLVGNTRILSAESVAEMIKPHMQVDRDRFYGYGMAVSPNYHGKTVVEHSGGLKGIASQVFFLPEQELTGVVLTNLDGGPSKQMMNSVLNALEGRPLDALPVTYSDYPVLAERLPGYVGRFTSGELESIDIRLNDGQLSIDFSGKISLLRAVAEDAFVFTSGRLQTMVRFIRDADDQVHRVAFGSRQLAKQVSAS